MDEIRWMLNDFKHFLTRAEEICRKGHTDSGQEIAVFYSDIALYNDIYLIESTDINKALFYAQGFNPIFHKESPTFEVMRKWIDAWLCCSNPICGTAELEGKSFFLKSNTV